MAVKVFAIGNVLMGDDGAGVRVVEEIKGELERTGICVIIGETDIYYCLSEIVEGDYIFIVDAVIDYECQDEVIIKPLNKLMNSGKYYSQHGLNLLTVINAYSTNINGYFMGIRIERNNIRFVCEISTDLNHRLKRVSKLVLNKINEVVLKESF